MNLVVMLPLWLVVVLLPIYLTLKVALVALQMLLRCAVWIMRRARGVRAGGGSCRP